jgi:hypothetical protein
MKVRARIAKKKEIIVLTAVQTKNNTAEHPT